MVSLRSNFDGIFRIDPATGDASLIVEGGWMAIVLKDLP